MSPRLGLALIAALAALGIIPSASSSQATLTGSITLTDQSWSCDGPVNLTSVTVVIRSVPTDAVHLGSGCTGAIGSIKVVQFHGDGIKVGAGAHDLVIGSGSIRCFAHDVGKHQDGIQAMGGQRVTFRGLDDQCLSANNSALFINQGSAGLEVPTDVVCDGCFLTGGGIPVRIALSLRSGIRNSRICAGHIGALRISFGLAVSPINLGTVILPFNPKSGSCTSLATPPAPAPPPSKSPSDASKTESAQKRPTDGRHRKATHEASG